MTSSSLSCIGMSNFNVDISKAITLGFSDAIDTKKLYAWNTSRDRKLKNEPTPGSFCLFSMFSNNIFTEENVGFSRIRTQIVGVTASTLATKPPPQTQKVEKLYH